MLSLSRFSLPCALVGVLLAGAFLLAGCDATAPDTVGAAAGLPSASAACALGLSDTEAYAELDALEAEIDALEAAGSLNSGQANALRNHLANVRQKIGRGQYCPALAQLNAFRNQVGNFVAAGVLIETEAAPLIDGADDIAEGEDDAPLSGRIAFTRLLDGSVYQIHVMDADGSNVVQLTDNAVGSERPSFSPDGSMIAFASYRDGSYDIYVMDADGSNVVQLTDNPPDNYYPTFSPDGSKIAFSRILDGNPDIYVMDADGSNVVQLTDNEAWDLNPSWGPSAP